MTQAMTSRIIGGILLIVGTSLGGGMLALPMATAAGGYWHALFLFMTVWAVTLIAAFYILEACMYLPEGSHFVSAARHTWGKKTALLVGGLLWFFLYVLLSGYTAGGSGLVQVLVEHYHGVWPGWLYTLFFSSVFGLILYRGVSAVDWVNRGLMGLKLLAYIVLVISMAPSTHLNVDAHLPLHHLSGAILVVVTAFGFGGSVPTVRNYCQSNVSALIKTLVAGSFIPLVCYLLWDWVVQGNIPAHGEHGLIAMAHAPHAVATLTTTLASNQASGRLAESAIHWFMSLCVTTSFLAVGIGLVDFIADALSIDRNGKYAFLPTVLAVLPPMFVVMVAPGLFMRAIVYAGALCVLLLVLLPALMVWRGRYVRGLSSDFTVFGGRGLLATIIAMGLILFAFSCYQLS